MPMKIMDDLDGDGVPDGAEVTFKRREVDPDTGEMRDVTATWTKGNTPRPIMEFPAEVKPVAAADQMQAATPRAIMGDPQAQLERNIATNADLAGIRRSDASQAVNPARPEDTRAFLERRMGDLSLSPELRKVAGARLAIMDENAARSSGQASMERRTGMEAAGVAAKAQADRDARMGAAVVTGQSRVDAAEAGAQGRVDAAGVTAEQRDRDTQAKLQMSKERNAAYIEARKLALEARKETDPQKLRGLLIRLENQGYGVDQVGNKLTISNYISDNYDKNTGEFKDTRTTFDGKTVANEPDLIKESQLTEINEVRAKLGRPALFARAWERQPEAPSAAERGNAPAAGSGMVKIRAPDGSVRSVPAGSVEKYLQRGGVIVE